MKKISFEDWMAQVDREVEKIAYVSVYDLPDYMFRDAYDDGEKPENVAKRVLEEAGWDMF